MQEPLLSGTWHGYYDHHNKSYSSKNFPITAMIEQQGRSLNGIMIDGVTRFRLSYRALVEANEGRMSAFAEDWARQILEVSPDLMMESTLPEESRIEGKIAGDQVRFTKTYLGPHEHFQDLDRGKILIRRVDRHRVHYQGTFHAQSGLIAGTWSILGGGFLGLFRRPIGTGGFELLRDKSADSPGR